MAFVDIAFLRNQDIVGDTIRYVRRKTGQRLVIRIEPCIAKLIGRYAGAGRISGYVFPLLSSDDPVRAFSQYRTALDYYNRRLKSCPVCWGSKSRSPPIPRGIRGRPQPGTITFRCRSSVREWDMLRKNHADLPGLARKLRYRPGEPEPDSILIRVRSLYKR